MAVKDRRKLRGQTQRAAQATKKAQNSAGSGADQGTAAGVDRGSAGAATAGSSSLTRLTWYFQGKPVPIASDLYKQLAPMDKVVIETMSMMPDCAPTLWKETETYLNAAMKKPAGQRDLRREMCYVKFIHADTVPGRPLLIIREAKSTQPISVPGATVLPSVDCPPWAFDPVKYTDKRLRLIDSVSGDDLHPMILVTYFTVPGGADSMSVDADGADASIEVSKVEDPYE